VIAGIQDIVAGVLILIGAGFALVAAIGILRLPDVYTRMHAASKAGTLGSGLMLLALAVLAGDFAVASRAIAGFVFFLLTAPVAAHLLAKAAYSAGHRQSPLAVADEMPGSSGEPVEP
jgi:multicomponent Na+:H+ antiporter subunit G